MMVAMGIGRFAYTPILPLMQRDLGMTNAVAGWLASLNYLGYLAGAIACSLSPRLLRSGTLNVAVLLTSIGSTLLMGVTTSPDWWGVLRVAAGFASAVLFVVIAMEVTEALARHGHSNWGASLYGGIGLGIALSGSIVPFLDHMQGWSGAWLGMGALAGVFSLAGITLARKRNVALAIPASRLESHGDLRSIRQLAAAYFCEGLGYIVSATFIVAMITRTPGLESFAPFSWVAVGIAAAPSTLLWQQVARRMGVRQALVLAYAIQATGILVSMKATSVAEACLAAVFFGGTFLGIVALVMAEGNRRAGSEGRRAAAILTACFGAGQVIGPPLAGMMADSQGSFATPLLLAALSVTVGGVLVARDGRFKHTNH